MSDAEDLFWDCAAELYAIDGVIESTMFGFRCLRVDGQFIGMPADSQLWVKLPAPRVEELIDAGTGKHCAPNGRVFKEWVGIAAVDEALWMALLTESIEFVRP